MADRQALIAEGKRLVREQEASGWRLAEIVHDLREDGMTYQAIADELGWKQATSAQRHERALLYLDTKDFTEAYVLASVSEDRASAIQAISEAEGLTLSSTRSNRTPEIRAIAAEIADLPQEDKERVARELASDPVILGEALAAHQRQKEETTRTIRESQPKPSRLGQTIAVIRVRKAAAYLDDEVRAVLDGKTRYDLDHEDRESLAQSAERIRVTLEYLEGVIGADWSELERMSNG